MRRAAANPLSLCYKGCVCPAKYPVSSLYPSLSLLLHCIPCLHGNSLPLQLLLSCCCSRFRDTCRPPNRLLHRGSGGCSGGLQPLSVVIVLRLDTCCLEC